MKSIVLSTEVRILKLLLEASEQHYRHILCSDKSNVQGETEAVFEQGKKFYCLPHHISIQVNRCACACVCKSVGPMLCTARLTTSYCAPSQSEVIRNMQKTDPKKMRISGSTPASHRHRFPLCTMVHNAGWWCTM